MPREIKTLLVSVGMLVTAIGVGTALMLAGAGKDWVLATAPLALTWALFLPADWPGEEGDDA